MSIDFIARGIAQRTAESIGFTNPRRIDLRQFSEGVGIGDETSDTDALHAAWFEAAAASHPGDGNAKGLYPTVITLPPASLLIGAGLDTDELATSGNIGFALEGAGRNATRLRLTDPAAWLVDTDRSASSLLFRDLQVHNGAGAYRQRSTQSTVSTRSGSLTFLRCAFSDYGTAAIVSNSDDDPFYHIWDCKFTGENDSRAIVLPPGGGHVVGGGTWINGGKYGIVLRETNDADIGYVRFGGTDGSVATRTDIWIVPKASVRAGSGINIHDCTHGNENDNAGDRDVLIADADTAGNPDHATQPTWESYEESFAASTENVRELRLLDNHYSCDGGRSRGIVVSRCQRLPMVFDGNISGDYPWIVEFDTAVIPELSLDNRWSQTSRISVRPRYTLGVGANPAVRVSNLPGFGFAVGDLAGDPSVPAHAGEDYPVSLMSNTMADLSPGPSALSGPMTDALGGTEALEITYDRDTGTCWQFLDTTDAEAGSLAWLEFDVRQADSRPITEAAVRIGTSYANYFRIVRFQVMPRWRRIAVPFLLPQVSSNLKAVFTITEEQFDPGAADKLMLGRIDAYHASCRK